MLSRRLVLTGIGAASVAALMPDALRAAPVKPDAASALIVIDVQNCFLPGGSLAVKDGERSFPSSTASPRLCQRGADAGLAHRRPCLVRVLALRQEAVRDRRSAYGKQVLWPDHCVQGTDGASLSKDLAIPHAGLVIRKGFNKGVDSYSAFTEADGKTTTGLAELPEGAQDQRVFVAGLATDFCVAWTRARRPQGRLRDLSSSRTPAAASTCKARSPRRGRTWRRRG